MCHARVVITSHITPAPAATIQNSRATTSASIPAGTSDDTSMPAKPVAGTMA